MTSGSSIANSVSAYTRHRDTSAETDRSAVRNVARHALNREDAWHLLDVLGLTGTAREMTRRARCAPKA
jgi:hypothetical protein